MSTEAIFLAVLQVVLGGFMWFLKDAYKDLKHKYDELRIELAAVKDSYIKKEDFREFKEELWKRLDKMEARLDVEK